MAKLKNLQPLRLADQNLERPSQEFLEKTLHPDVLQLLAGLGRGLTCTESAEDPSYRPTEAIFY